MNQFGKNFRVTIFGESHGNGVGIVVDGLPAGITITAEDFNEDLARRQGGNMAGTTPRKETDTPKFISGIFNDFTTGAPLTILFENGNTRSKDYTKQRAIPRPGHADFVAHKKFNGFEDYRGGGHFSGRLTVCIVAAGIIAKKYLYSKNNFIDIKAWVSEAGGNTNIDEAIENAITNNDSIGGIISGSVKGLPIGIGEPFFESIESKLAAAFFAIPAVKGVSFGSGFDATKMTGSQHNDSLINENGVTNTNFAGGILGGISNGNEVNFKIAIKPTSSTPKQQNSLNTETNKSEDFIIEGRHDLCIALRVPPVAEAMTAIVLADLYMDFKGRE